MTFVSRTPVLFIHIITYPVCRLCNSPSPQTSLWKTRFPIAVVSNCTRLNETGKCSCVEFKWAVNVVLWQLPKTILSKTLYNNQVLNISKHIITFHKSMIWVSHKQKWKIWPIFIGNHSRFHSISLPSCTTYPFWLARQILNPLCWTLNMKQRAYQGTPRCDRGVCVHKNTIKTRPWGG